MTLGAASDAVAAAAQAAAARVDPATAAALERTASRLGGRLILAVAGRLKSGKSTLVNALLGRDVAPTAATECTRLVTRFVRDTTEFLVVVGRDGTRTERGLEASRIPATIEGVDPATVDHLEVHLATSKLDWVDVVDTPGLASLRTENAERTETFLDPDSEAACAGADAIALCFTNIVRADDITTLQRVLASTGDRQGVATLAVLNRADEITGGWDVATRQAAQVADGLGGMVSGVTPIAALAGAAYRCGLLDTELVSAAMAIADLDGETRSTLCADPGLFTTYPCPVDESVRTRFVVTASFAGAVAAVDHLVTYPGDRVGATVAVDRYSRLSALDGYLSRLRRRADALKAQVGLTAIKRLARLPTTSAADAALLRNLVADVATSADLAVVDQLAVLESATRCADVLTAGEVAELDRLFVAGRVHARLGIDPHTPAPEAAALAWAAATRWQGVTTGWDPPARRHAAKVARRAYMHLWEQLTASANGDRP